MDLDLSDKVALVTGAGIGIGRTIAHALSDEGCRLAVVGRREALMQELAEALEKVISEVIDAPIALGGLDEGRLKAFTVFCRLGGFSIGADNSVSHP